MSWDQGFCLYVFFVKSKGVKRRASSRRGEWEVFEVDDGRVGGPSLEQRIQRSPVTEPPQEKNNPVSRSFCWKVAICALRAVRKAEPSNS